MSRLRRFIHLPGEQRWDLLAAVCLLAGVRLGLWLLPFRLLLRLVSRLTPQVHAGSATRLPRASQVAWAIQTASRYVPGTRACLPRALAVHMLLARRGVPARLRIGVARAENGLLDAHAWVEDQEGVLVGNLPDLSRFTAFPLINEATR